MCRHHAQRHKLGEPPAPASMFHPQPRPFLDAFSQRETLLRHLASPPPPNSHPPSPATPSRPGGTGFPPHLLRTEAPTALVGQIKKLRLGAGKGMAQNQQARGAEPGPWQELSGSWSRALGSPPCPGSPRLPQGSQLASRDGKAAAQGLSSLCQPYKAASGETWPLSATEPEVGGSQGEQSQRLTACRHGSGSRGPAPPRATHAGAAERQGPGRGDKAILNQSLREAGTTKR